MSKENYIVTARVDDSEKYFTLKNVSRAQLSRTAEKVAQNLFYTDNVKIINHEIYV